ncbi:MAG: hypothetical protein K6G76_10660 [Lachnospiraceae bacterium]|nr:hypothetical protein [Lachnospiraceae bacterium]
MLKKSIGCRVLSIILTLVMLVTLIPNVGVKEVKADNVVTEINISSDKFALQEVIGRLQVIGHRDIGVIILQ